MIWSRARFEDEGTQLCRCLQEVARITNDGEPSSVANKEDQKAGFGLLHWELQRDSVDGSLYLQHATITTINQSHLHQDRRQQQEDPQHEAVGEVVPDYDLEDDSVLVDSELYVEDPNKSPVVDSMMIQWTFSVVYSDTYRVPVLYFHVQNPDGSPCSRSQVVQWLSPTSASTEKGENSSTEESLSGTTETSSWEFVSQEQHPHTGFPSYFLHPCRTSERMKLLQEVATVPLDDSNDTQSSWSSSSSIHFLWAWMSMILPAVNHTTPPKLYGIVRDKLQER
jgi:hypothetical protein